MDQNKVSPAAMVAAAVLLIVVICFIASALLGPRPVPIDNQAGAPGDLPVRPMAP